MRTVQSHSHEMRTGGAILRNNGNRSTIEELMRATTSHNNRTKIRSSSSTILSSASNLNYFNRTISTIANQLIMKRVKVTPLPHLTMKETSISSLSSDTITTSSLTASLPPIPSSTTSFYSTLTTSEKGDRSSLILSNNRHVLSSNDCTSPATTRVTLTKLPTLSSSIRRSNSTSKKDDTSMDDEYGAMNASGETFTYPSPYHLESYGILGHTGSTATTQSGVLNPAYLKYKTYGTLNAQRDNVLVICHALTGNASLEAWWGDLLGPGKAFDTDQYFIVCCNILGSCYGSVSPSSKRPGYTEDNNIQDERIPRDTKNQAIYGMDFPDVSVRDTVRLQLLLLKHELKITSVKCVIGGSFGGMQAMEYCVMAGATRSISIGTVDSLGNVWPHQIAGGNSGSNAINDDEDGIGGDKNAVAYGIGEFVTQRNGRIEPFVRSAVPIACGAAHTAWQISISETQRQAIYADPKWKNGRYDPHDPPTSGLSVARQIAMVSYRTPLGYHKKFGRALANQTGPSYGSKAPWQVKSYLEYQGKKFLERFDPVTYVKLTEQMDSHDIGRGRGSIEKVLSHVEIPVCVLGIDSDVLYPLREQEEMVRAMPNAELKIISSDSGHDGFLLEQDQVSAHIKSFLYSHS